jgi:twitching motility two-component system response regulator PilH
MMSKSILVIDDDELVRESLGFQLQAEGFTVNTATDGNEAWTKIQNHPPDLVVTDICMSHMNGFELCKRLKFSSTLCLVPVIMLTARSPEEDKFFNDYVKPDRYLTKPVKADELLACIKDLLHMQPA